MQLLLDTLDLPIPFNLDAFLAGLTERRGRPVRLAWTDAATRPHSLLVTTLTADVIMAAQNTSSFHRLQLVLREVGHLLVGQPQPPDAFVEVAPANGQGWERLRRHAAAHPADQAESYDLFGYLLLMRVQRLQAASDPHHAAALRVADFLEGRP